MKTGNIKRNLKKVNKLLLSILMIATSFTVIPNTMKQVDAASKLEMISWIAAPVVGTRLAHNKIYKVSQNMTIGNGSGGYNGLVVDPGTTTYLFIPTDVTLTVYGRNGSWTSPGYAAILLPSGANLYVIGSGTLSVYGGSSGTSRYGESGGSGILCYEGGPCRKDEQDNMYAGYGGAGGDGAGGAGAGIGGNGGSGGPGGSRTEGAISIDVGFNDQKSGNRGDPGRGGGNATSMGSVYFPGDTKVTGYGGSGASTASGGASGSYWYDGGDDGLWYGEFTAAGGGGGAGGGPTDSAGIFRGGTGGSGGGGGGGSGGNQCSDSGSDVEIYGGRGGTGLPTGRNGEDAVYRNEREGRGGMPGSSAHPASNGGRGTIYSYHPTVGGVTRDAELLTHPDLLNTTAIFSAEEADLGKGTTSRTETIGVRNTEKIEIPARTGYDFKGYYTQRNGKGIQYFYGTNHITDTSPDKAGEASRDWDFNESTTTLYAHWERTNFTYNEVPSKEENGVTATVSFSPLDFAPYESQVNATITLSGTPEATGAHLITLTSKSLEAKGVDFKLVIFIHLPEGTPTTYSQSLNFKIPDLHIIDMTLTHTVVTTPELYNQTKPYTANPIEYGVYESFEGLEIGELNYRKMGASEVTDNPPIDAGEYEVTIPIKETVENSTYYLKKQLDITKKVLEWDTEAVIPIPKKYDGNTDAAFSGKVQVKGIEESDNKVRLINNIITDGKYENHNADTNKLVYINTDGAELAGERSENYKLPNKQPTMRSDINGKTPRVKYMHTDGGPGSDEGKILPVNRTFNSTIQEIAKNGDSFDNILDFKDPDKDLDWMDPLDGENTSEKNEPHVSYEYYKNTNGSIKTTPEIDGSSSVGTAPKNAGRYFVKASYVQHPKAPQYDEAHSEMLEYNINTLELPDVTVDWVLGQEGFVYDSSGGISGTYNEKEIKPKVLVYTDANKKTLLKEDIDYEITYEKNINAGTATAVVNLIKNYSGSKSKDFTIKQETIDISDIRMTGKSFSYDKQKHGNEIDSIYQMLKKDKFLTVSYNYKGTNTTYDSTIRPSGVDEYVVTATFATTNPNRKLDPAKNTVTAVMSIFYEKVTIDFDFNGGKDDKGNITDKWDEVNKYTLMGDHAIPIPVPSKDGYDLIGWANKKIIYSDKNIENEEVVNPITYEAVWEKKNIDVTFNANGGTFNSSGIETRTYTQPFGTKLEFARIEAPKLSNRKFLGWSTLPSAPSVDVGARFEFNEKGTLIYYAVWEDEKFDISLNFNGGTNAAGEAQESFNVTAGEKISASGHTITEPIKPSDGNITKFDGWVDMNDEDQLLLTTDKLQDETPKTNTKYLAQWDGDKIKVTFKGFDKNAGEVAYDTPILTSGVTPISPVITEPQGHKFLHWKVTQSDGTTNPLPMGETYTENELKNVKVFDNVTFTAVFEILKYEVEFELNDGLQDQDDTTDLIQTVEYDNNAAEPSVYKEGAEFMGWYNVNSGITVKKDDIKNDKIKDNTLYIAQWKTDVKTVTLYGNEGLPEEKKIDVNYGEFIDLNDLVPPERVGYKFEGWASTPEKGTDGIVDIAGRIQVKENLNFYAAWSDVKYTVKFQDEKGNVIDSKEILEGNLIESEFLSEPPMDPRDHEEFIGWKVDGKIPEDEAGEDWQEIKNMKVLKNHTFTTIYREYEYTLTFDVNGGTDGPSEIKGKSDKVVVLDDLKKPIPPKGMAFDGWFSATVDGSKVEEVPLTKNTTVYARYVNGDSSYKVTHWERALNGSYALVKEDTLEGLTGSTPTGHEMERTGFDYQPDKTTYGTSTELESTAPKEVASDGTLVIKYFYERKSFKVDYTVGGYDESVIPSTYDRVYKYGEPVTVEEKLAVEGYGFEGWYGKGVIISNNLFVMPANNVTIEGQFNLARFRVNYEIEDVTNTTIVDNDSYRPADKVTVTDKVPERAGYIFDGWMYEGKYVDVNEYFVMPTKDVVFIAAWHKETYTVAFEDNNKVISEEIKWLGDVVEFPDLPARDYEVFLGWDVDGILYSGDGQFIVNEDTSVKFVAKWEVDRYDLSYKLNNGNKDEKVIFEKGKTNNLRLTAGRDGYEFKGWYLDESLQTKVDQLAPAQQEDMTLYAGWEEVKEVVQRQSDSVYSGNKISSIDNSISNPIDNPLDKKADDKKADEDAKKDNNKGSTSNATNGISKAVNREEWRYYAFPILVLLYLGAYALIWNKKKEEEVD